MTSAFELSLLQYGQLMSSGRHDVTARRTPRVVILSQYIYPESNSTGELMTSLATGLVENGFQVTAYSAQPTYFGGSRPVPRRLTYLGVRINRMRNTRFGRARFFGRVTDALTFAAATGLRLLRLDGTATLLSVTNPPFLPVLAALHRKFRRGAFVLLIHDVYPEAAVQLHRIRRSGVLHRAWSRIDRFTLSQADRIVVLGEDMRRVVAAKLSPGSESRLVVIPNWADGDRIAPMEKTASLTAKTYGLLDSFVVQYSGNVGLSQDLGTVLNAAWHLRGERITFTIVGEGVALPSLKAAVADRSLSNVRFLPRASDQQLSDSLAACDASLIPLARGMEGLSVPSKYYSILASGRPVIAVMDERAEVAQSVIRDGCGVTVPPGDAKQLAAAVLKLKGESTLCGDLGRNAREAFDRRYGRERSVRAYADLLSGIATQEPTDRAKWVS